MAPDADVDDLWRAHDRRAHPRPEAAEVVDRDGRAGELRGAQLALARGLRERGDLVRELGQRARSASWTTGTVSPSGPAAAMPTW
jgi:hypothetical protein